MSEQSIHPQWYQRLQRSLGNYPGTIIFSSLFFLAFAGVIFYLTGLLAGANQSDTEAGANRLIALLGALSGWAVGIFFSPFTKDEREQFEGIGKIVSAFAAGYILSKAEAFLNSVLFPAGYFPLNAWLRTGIFFASFMLGGLVVFIHRLYSFRDINTAKNSKT